MIDVSSLEEILSACIPCPDCPLTRNVNKWIEDNRDQENVIKDAELLRLKKITLVKKQLEKLEKLLFE